MKKYQFGSATLAKIKGSDEFRKLLGDRFAGSETIIIKPNWVTTDPADFTSADTLRLFFETADLKWVVTESYCLARSLNILENGLKFEVQGEEVNWRWLLKGDGWKWLIQNPDWDWFIEGEHWSQIQKEEEAFLEKYGFAELFDEFNVSYVNVTQEVWSGRIANPIAIKDLVEGKFTPVQHEKLYSQVPKKLYDLRGSTLISLARLKMYASYTIKNLFGLNPDPLRPWWHGPKNSRIARSVVDINKIYHALFNVFGFCEAIYQRAIPDPEGKFEGIYAGKYNVKEGDGFVAYGGDLVYLDSLLLYLTQPAKRLITEANLAPIELAEKEFAVIDRGEFKNAKSNVGDWV